LEGAHGTLACRGTQVEKHWSSMIVSPNIVVSNEIIAHLLFFKQVVDDSTGVCKKDAIYFSVHKFVGGPQTPGILIAKRKLFDPENSPHITGTNLSKNSFQIYTDYWSEM